MTISDLHFKNVQIKYVRRASRLTIRFLDSQTMRVTAPLTTSVSEIQTLLNRHSKWILEKQQMLTDQEQKKKMKLITGQVLPFYGEQLRLNMIDGTGPTTRLGDDLNVSISLKISLSGNSLATENAIKKKVINWYKAEALKKIIERVQFFEKEIQVSSKTISLKNYKSRWGACNSKKDLIFNWQIVTLKRDLFDYVVAHEVCHLKEMNHSPHFYAWLLKLGFQRNIFQKQMRQQIFLF